ncbi:YceI family protein [Castellaniella sp.]|uniref:YceI family protein n=1 Tax=Castellaniella sp. TaxID=1955812 RepID=UPI0035617961
MKRLCLIPLLCLAGYAQAADYAVDPDHTYVTFEVLHHGTSTVRGRFDAIDGQIQFDRQARAGHAAIQIDMASINSGSAGFDQHLQGPDFFNVAQYPTAVFESTAFVFDGDTLSAVEGSLRLLGQAHPVTLQAVRFNCYQNARIQREVCGGDFQVDLQRSQWGMGFGLPGIPDTVRLQIEIEGVRQG